MKFLKILNYQNLKFWSSRILIGRLIFRHCVLDEEILELPINNDAGDDVVIEIADCNENDIKAIMAYSQNYKNEAYIELDKFFKVFNDKEKFSIKEFKKNIVRIDPNDKYYVDVVYGKEKKNWDVKLDKYGMDFGNLLSKKTSKWEEWFDNRNDKNWIIDRIISIKNDNSYGVYSKKVIVNELTTMLKEIKDYDYAWNKKSNIKENNKSVEKQR